MALKIIINELKDRITMNITGDDAKNTAHILAVLSEAMLDAFQEDLGIKVDSEEWHNHIIDCSRKALLNGALNVTIDSEKETKH